MRKPHPRTVSRLLRPGGVLLAASVSGWLGAACASAPAQLGRTAGPDFVVYPTPPDTPRIQFLMTLSSEVDVTGKRGTSLIEALAGESDETEYRGFNKPYGIGLRDGRLYVCDTMLAGVVVMDLRARTFEQWKPEGDGTLRKPINCFVDDADGRLYVADTERSQVVVFDSTRAYVSAFGEREGARPTDVFVEGERIWVSDLGGQRVRVYDRTTFEQLRAFPEPGEEAPKALFSPTNLYVRGDRVYVSDFGDFKVKIYSTDGEFIRSVGSYGRALGQFVRPKGIAVDREGIMYVVDAGFENVQMFDDEGQLLMFFGGRYEGLGDMWLPAKVILSYGDLDLFEPLVRPGFALKYLVLVTNQYGPDRINIYGFIEPAPQVGDDETP